MFQFKKYLKLLINFNLLIINAFTFSTVEKGKLYRSYQLKPKRLRHYIKKYKIKSIINLRGVNKNAKWWKREKQVAKSLYINFYNIPMNASKLPSKKNIKKLLAIYDSAPKPILIHCKGGADRTGEASAIWILVKTKKGKKVALKQLSIKYKYVEWLRPLKKRFIKLWKDKDWALNKYDPKLYK